MNLQDMRDALRQHVRGMHRSSSRYQVIESEIMHRHADDAVAMRVAMRDSLPLSDANGAAMIHATFVQAYAAAISAEVQLMQFTDKVKEGL